MRTLAVLLLAVVLTGCSDVIGFGQSDPGAQPGSGEHTPLVGRGGDTAAVQAVPLGSAPTPAATPAAPQAPAPAGKHAAAVDAHLAVRSVVLKFTPEARQRLATDPRFSEEALQAAVDGQFSRFGLLAPRDGAVQSDLQITVSSFSVTPATNVAFMGYVFSQAMLVGDAQVIGERQPGRSFAVSARVRLTEKGGAGSDPLALQSLYRRFALIAADELRGVDTPPEPVPR